VSWPIRALGLLTFGLVTNLLSDAFPRPALIALILVGAVVVAMFHLPEDAPARQVLPGALLYLAVAAAALAVVTPASWTGPLTVVSVLLVLIGCTALAVRHRAAALVSLAGLSLFTIGLVCVTGAADETYTSAKVIASVLGGFVAVFGLLLIVSRRHLAGPGGISMASLREMRVTWSRAGTIGAVAAIGAIQVARDGEWLVASLMVVAGLSWLATTMTFVFAEHAESFAGAMLTVCGVAATGLGLVAFHSSVFLPGAIALLAGLAMAGGGLTLLESEGVLAGLTALFRSPTKTDQNHASVRPDDGPSHPAGSAPARATGPSADPAEPPRSPEP